MGERCSDEGGGRWVRGVKNDGEGGREVGERCSDEGGGEGGRGVGERCGDEGGGREGGERCE